MAEAENNPSQEGKAPVALIPEGVDVSSFLLRTPVEIGFVLRSLAQKGDLVSVYFDHGQFSFLSAILECDTKQQRFWFDICGVEAINRSLLRADHIVFAAAPEGVRIQFVLDGGISLVDYDERPAFEAAFPNDLIKLQRREYFRLDTPIGKPLLCKLRHPNGRVLDLPLHDISIGGMGLWMQGQVEVEQLDVFPGCRVDLGTFGMVELTIEIRSKRQVTKRDGTVQTMLGTRFVDLPRQTENLLQRYIAQLERERHQLLRN
ncbi:flagellar brake protein [Chitinimonas viridis]|uniref:Flagellar brake protein YcgR n=1 Tax=Chitinimonas viridis TaxID=664880 RepID=A0ABT8B2R4_9NEIS|nr:flagellar brake protein [Chitinimonas viridis]MDN3576548.1 flagellar brake protein [Chitinimonas viridis]